MTVVREGLIELRFAEGWVASKYDEWPFYRDHVARGIEGTKAVDVVALALDSTLWLVEIKDYRAHGRTKPMDLADEVAIKVRDTLAGIFIAAKSPSEHTYRGSARRGLAASRIRVVLHLEQPARPSRLTPHVVNPVNLQQKLKQLLRAVDAHPLVVDLTTPSLPWIATPVSTAT